MIEMVYEKEKSKYRVSMCIFFMVGFFTSINSILITHIKNSLNISYAAVNLISMAYFLSYFIMSTPFGIISQKFSYKFAIQISLIFGMLGCLLFMISMSYMSFILLLISVFFIALFSTGTEVAVNPLVDEMGPIKSSSQRLTFVHFFDSFGTIIGPLFASFIFIYSVSEKQVSSRILIFYGLVMLVMFYFLKNISGNFSEKIKTITNTNEVFFDTKKQEEKINYKHLIFGATAIFCYVGSEVAIANFIISYASLPSTGLSSVKTATLFVSLYWSGQFIGRLFGGYILNKIKTHYALVICSLLNFFIILISIYTSGYLSLILITFTGLFNSIMYPSIFSLTVSHLNVLKAKASGLLHMGVIGGAIIPVFQGIIADEYGVKNSYLLPMMLFLPIAIYSFFSYQFQNSELKTGDLK